MASDSILRIYECLEIYNASSWQLTEELDISTFGAPPILGAGGSGGSFGIGGSGISPSFLFGPIPTPGVEHASPASSDGITRRSSTPSLQAHTAPSRLGSISGLGTGPTLGSQTAGSSVREAESGWCLSWCKEKWWGEVIAVSAGTTPSVKVRSSSSNTFPFIPFTVAHLYVLDCLHSIQIISLPPSPTRPILLASLDHRPPSNPSGFSPSSSSLTQSITAVSWAPMSGRSYHLLATGSRDSYVRVWKIKPGANVPWTNAPAVSGISAGAGQQGLGVAGAGPPTILAEEDKWTHALVGEFDDHK
jgi:nucleoporin SEH1